MLRRTAQDERDCRKLKKRERVQSLMGLLYPGNGVTGNCVDGIQRLIGPTLLRYWINCVTR